MRTILNFLRRIIPERSPMRLMYHKISAILAAVWYRFPSKFLRVVGVTGTSGKSTTVELLHHIFQHAEGNTASLSTVQYHFRDQVLPNKTLRTGLNPWETQEHLRHMVKENIETVIIEVSSHGIDQHRFWGINFDTALCINVLENEHLDYHKTFLDYMLTKKKLFEVLNASKRKPKIPKISVTNKDDANFEEFHDVHADKKWTFSKQKNADIRAENIKYTDKSIEFSLRVPNNTAQIEVPMIGEHNLEDILAAITVAMAHSVPIEKIQAALKEFPGVPGRLESIDEGQDFSVVVDFTYKPSALQNVLRVLKGLCKGRLIVIWGGAYSRTKENLEACTDIIQQYADEYILTTDDPGDDDIRRISGIIRDRYGKEEGDGFWEIEDRYEAIRYGLQTAQPGDMVLVAGRGHETIQTIGKKRIEFDDREVSREILRQMKK